jgi:hypothetical protein
MHIVFVLVADAAWSHCCIAAKSASHWIGTDDIHSVLECVCQPDFSGHHGAV